MVLINADLDLNFHFDDPEPDMDPDVDPTHDFTHVRKSVFFFLIFIHSSASL